MFFSYQQEYPVKLEQKVNFINKVKQSKLRNDILEKKSYFNGENKFIDDYVKRIWVENKETTSSGEEVIVGRLAENVFAPNFKTRYNFFGNMVSQKVNALFGESPIITNLDENYTKKLGYYLKNAGEEASIVGYSFVYVGLENIKPFETENCIAFEDDITKDLKRFIRFWCKKINDNEILFFEDYDEEGFITYKVDGNKIEEFIPKQAYKSIIKSSSLSTEKTSIRFEQIPIIVFKNNKEKKSDLTLNVKSKIDLIDLIESGLVNNIEEFSDVWITVNCPNATEEDVQRLKETVRRTKTAMFAGDSDKANVGFQTLQIPYEARKTAVEMLKQELVEDTGVIDFKEIKGSATATEINARMFKLKQRVSDFEWYADEVATSIVETWQLYWNNKFDFTITFQKLFINNNNEIVNIAIQVYDKVSKRAFLNLLKQAGVIENVDEELAEQQKESIYKFDLGVGDDTGTQTNGQDNFDNQQE